MYSLTDFGRMIEDSVRMQAHAEALRRVVHEGSVVVDIGCGTGIFSLIACQCGARRVYAIDPSEFVHLAARRRRELDAQILRGRRELVAIGDDVREREAGNRDGSVLGR